MNLNDFAKLVTQKEGKKKQVNIAQIKEILKIVNGLVNGILYKAVNLKKVD